MIKRTDSFQLKQAKSPRSETQEKPDSNQPSIQHPIVKSSQPNFHLATLFQTKNQPSHNVNPNHQQIDLKIVQSNIIRRGEQVGNGERRNQSIDSILDDEEARDKVQNLSEKKHHPTGIGMNNINVTHQIRGKPPTSNSNNRMIQTAQSKMTTSSNSKGTKIPPSVLESIRMLASGKKPLQNMTTSKITRNLMEKYREVKNSNNFICEICACQYEESQKSRISKCSHQFCDSCLRHYVDYKIARFQQVSCPSEGCQQVMDKQGAFYATLSQQLKNKYAKVNAFYEVSKNQNMRMCPDQKCNDGVLKIQNQENPTCNKCSKVFCNSCLFPVHNGPCQKNQVDFFQNNLHFRQCSKCKAVVEKTMGCNHITCTCKYQFCYLCGAKWTSYEHRCNQANGGGGGANANANADCCQCFHGMGGDGCIGTFVRLLVKIFLCFPLFLVLLVFLFAKTLVQLAVMLLLTIVLGLTAYACEWMCQRDGWLLALLIIIYPITMMIGVGIAFDDFYAQVFCQILGSFCEQVQGISQGLLCWD